MGVAKKIFSMEIHIDCQAQKLILSQKNYIKRVFQRFNIGNSKPMSTASQFNLSYDIYLQSNIEREQMSHVPYSSAVGSLVYAIVCTWPNLSHVVSVVRRYMSNAGKKPWQAVKWIFRYLKGTTNIGLAFDRNKVTGNNVIGYVDSDYAGDLGKWSSISSYILS